MENRVKIFERLSLIVALLALVLVVGARPASATTCTIVNDASVCGTLPLGDFYLVAPNAEGSSPGQVFDVLKLQTNNFESATSPVAPASGFITMGHLWTTLNAGGLTDVQKLVFGLGINESGAVGTNWVDVLALTMNFNGTIFDLDSGGDNNLIVWNDTQGQSTAEARIGVDFGAGFNFMTTYSASSTAPFAISSSINGTSDGFELYFLSSGFTGAENPQCQVDCEPPCPTPPCGGGGGETPVVPEPASLLLFGTGLVAVAGLRQRMKKRG